MPRPIEPPGGQDDPPDVRTSVAAVLVLLDDVRLHLSTTHHDRDLLLRVVAVQSALKRLRIALDHRDPP